MDLIFFESIYVLRYSTPVKYSKSFKEVILLSENLKSIFFTAAASSKLSSPSLFESHVSAVDTQISFTTGSSNSIKGLMSLNKL